MGGRDAPQQTVSGAAGAREGTGGSRASVGIEIWGVLNVTPDSFSDGGRFVSSDGALSVARARAHAEEMHAAGADVIDVGGASSRPPGRTYGAGAPSVTEAEEIARVVPVIEALFAMAEAAMAEAAMAEAAIARPGPRISIDTTSAAVAARSLAAGASIVNDVSMGASDALLEVVAQSGAELVLMHTRDGGRVDARTTAYGDVVADVIDELDRAVARAVARGVREDRIWIDPGIGFAKTAAQSAALLAATSRLVRGRGDVAHG
nr:dihydropteroate synthase [Myxococcota bacterium]